MPSAAPAVELIERPQAGRVFSMRAKVRLGDVDSGGRLRLDSTARLMQDVATDDASDAGLDRRFGWLVRRTMIDTASPARLGEWVEASTWCAGIGAAWAERRTQIVGERGAVIEAVSLWVQIDASTGVPARVAADFTDVYAATAAGRTVSARLSLPELCALAVHRGSWPVRRTDLDPFEHVNNAATWEFVEEHARLDESDRVGRAELEYLQPVELDSNPQVATDQRDSWLLIDGAVAAAGRWTPTNISAG